MSTMTDVNRQQIEEKLNEIFPDYGQRKIIFWFDPNQDFLEDIKKLDIMHAKIYVLESDAQFKAKRHLEYEDKESNYLVYAPFKRWDDKDEDNHLLSILKYSEEFSADRLAMLMSELSIPLEFHSTMEKYSTFFNAKDRVKSFGELSHNTTVNKAETIELMIMAVLLKTRSIRLNDLLRDVLKSFASGDDDPLEVLEKYHLKTRFWGFIGLKYGFSDTQLSIEKLVICLYVNYFYYQIDSKVPEELKDFEVQNQRTNIIAFMDQFMNDTRYTESFQHLSQRVFKMINGEKILDTVKIDDLMEADIFSDIHEYILSFYLDRLLSSDTTTKVSGYTIIEALKQREKLHFASNYIHEYQLLKHAYYLVDSSAFKLSMTMDDLTTLYEKELYWIDTHYRKFIWNSDQIQHDHKYDQLKRLVELNYSRFLDQTGQIWNRSFDFSDRLSIRHFYHKVVMNRSIKTVVIISDAFRYELGKELVRQFSKEKKYSAEDKGAFSVLPSVTEFGKAALLPHKQLDYTTNTDVLVDGKKTNGLINRSAILQQQDSDAIAFNYSDVVKMNKTEVRENLNGKSVIYIYHDQVDKVGDHSNESQVFDACDTAIKEIFNLVNRLANDGNISRFIVTADHGFIYKRQSIEESDKIDNPSTNPNDRVERRFIVTDEEYDVVGTKNYSLGESLGNNDTRNICVPVTSNIFKKAGGGQNYVHGGSSIQEMLVPIIEITSSRISNTKDPVEVELMTSNRRVTGLSTTLEFYQKSVINELFEPVSYWLYFEDNKGERISNEETYIADSKEEEANSRFQKFVFEFINRRYLVQDDYYLVMKNQVTGIEERIKFIIDNPFAQQFDFDI